MKKNLFIRKGVALALSALMVFGTVPTSAYAYDEADDGTAIESVIDNTGQEDLDVKSSAEEKTADESSVEGATSDQKDESSKEEDTVQATEKTKEDKETAEKESDTTKKTVAEESKSVKETTEEPTKNDETEKFTAIAEDSVLSEEELDSYDFSSKRLLIAGDIIDPENELSSYDGVHLMQYKDETTAKYAFSYYYGKVAFVDIDTTISIAIGEGGAAGSSEMSEDDNPLNELAEATPTSGGNNVIALIDTGVNDNSNVIASVSMLGDDTSDANGHGTRMAELISEANPDAKIISIKALGADGTGDSSAIYAAIRYAVESGAGIINLSISSPKKAENAAIASAISEARASGIKVVAAAGNNANNAAYYIPGGLDGVITIGAANANGTRLSSSNYGDCVNYNVVADSTSEAAATYSGLLSAGKGDVDYKIVYPVDYSVQEGPSIRQQITFFDWQSDDITDAVLVAARERSDTTIENGMIKSILLFSKEDAKAVKQVEVFTDFMSVKSETNITSECTWDPETVTVSIPEKYKDANLTVRWYMSNASYMYTYVDEYPAQNTPSQYYDFAVAFDGRESSWEEGGSIYATDFNQPVYTVKSNDFDTFSVGSTFYVSSGSTAVFAGGTNPVMSSNRGAMAFGNKFDYVTNDSTGEEATFLENIGYEGTYVDGTYSAVYGNWVFGTCVYDELGGSLPQFEGARIKCVDKTDDTATFFFQSMSSTAQWNAGRFSITFEKIGGYLSAQKVSANSATTNNACYDLSGIQFKVYTDANCSTEATDANGNSILLTSGKNGRTGSVQIAEGTYWVKEVASSLKGKGWYYNSTPTKVTVTTSNTESNVAVAEVKNEAYMDPIGIALKKVDSVTGQEVAQGDGSLAGAQFTVKYYSNQSATGTPAATWVFKTNEKGYLFYSDSAKVSGPALYKDKSGTPSLPAGTITIQETKAPEGYLVNSEVITLHFILQNDNTFKITDKNGKEISKQITTGNVANLNVSLKERPIYGGVSFQKVDAETKGNAQGEATLQGAKIDIYNVGTNSVKIDGKTYAKGDKIMTLVTDKNGKCSTAKDALPYGTYKAVESEASEGYTLNTSWSVTFKIRENNVIVDTASASAKVKADSNKSGWTNATGNTATAAQLPEYVKRADLVITKLDDEGNPLGNIPFLIERLDKNGKAVESHVIVTDENGYLNTAERPKTGEKVNCLDSYEKNGSFTDESKLTSDTGVWFGNAASDGSGKGSLTYGNYRVTELGCTANEGNDLLSKELFKTNDPKELFINGHQYTMTAFVDLSVDMRSSFIEDSSKTTIVPLGEDTAVTDTVWYTNLKTTSEYRLTTEVYYVSRDGSESKVLGSGSTDFTPEKTGKTATAKGKLTNTVTVNTSDLQGGTLYAVDTLYRLYNGRVTLIATHNNDFTEDNQALYVPYMATTAKDGQTGDHVGTVTENASVIDTVSYENLGNGRMYQLEGTLRYADTGEAVLDKDGNPCVVTQIVKCNWDIDAATTKKGVMIVPKNGEIEMPAFEFDASDLGNRTLVVTEVLTDVETEKVIINHDDLTDEDQSIHFVKVSTSAKDVNTGTKTAVVGTTTITDEVTMENLIVGQKYSVNGDLVYKTDCTDSTGAEHKKGDVIATHDAVEFIAEATTQTISLDYEVDASALAGISGVVFEDVWHNDVQVAKHHDYASIPQTPNWPSVKTTAIDKATGTHSGVINEKATIIDTVELNNLTEGDSYYIEGTLVNSDGEPFLVNGEKLVVKSEVFKAEDSSKTQELEFNFDASELEGKSLVVYEKLIFVGEDGTEVEVNRHEDKNDQGQTVDYPTLHTNATDGQTKDQVGTVGTTTVEDQVTYENLHVGETYTVSGDLHYTNDCTDSAGNKHKAGDTLLDGNGNPITANTTFTAETKNGSVTLTYKVDSSLLAGQSIVVFENLTQEDINVYSHADINDKDQRIDYPDVKTTAFDKKTETHMGSVDNKVELVDSVKLTNLEVGKTYQVSGVLMDAKTGEIVVDSKGATVSSESKSFEATDAEMTIELTFTVDDPELMYGRTTVVFEDLFHNGVKVAAHASLDDKDQQVEFPELHTTATDKATGDHDGHLDKNVTIVDRVEYSGLIEGKEYSVSGILYNKETGKKLLINGKAVTAEKKFTAEKSEGYIDIEFNLDSTALAGTSVVAFETLKYNDITVAIHADISDAKQTVTFVTIGTQAYDKASGSQTMTLGDNTVLTDKIQYKGLTPGKEYVISGEIYDKSTGESIGITSESTFTPDAADGETTVEFVLNTNNYQGKSLVVFESISDTKGNLIAEHKDIDSAEQTVNVPTAATATTNSSAVKTGDSTNLILWISLLGSAIAGLIGFIFRRRRLSKNNK